MGLQHRTSVIPLTPQGHMQGGLLLQQHHPRSPGEHWSLESTPASVEMTVDLRSNAVPVLHCDQRVCSLDIHRCLVVNKFRPQRTARTAERIPSARPCWTCTPRRCRTLNTGKTRHTNNSLFSCAITQMNSKSVVLNQKQCLSNE